MCACGVSFPSPQRSKGFVWRFSVFIVVVAITIIYFMQCAGSGRLVFSAFWQNPCLDHVVCFGLRVFAGACHVWVGDAIRKHRQGSLCSHVPRVVVAALLPKISPEEREQMSKDVAVASQRVRGI
jgi:hypothetical protein